MKHRQYPIDYPVRIFEQQKVTECTDAKELEAFAQDFTRIYASGGIVLNRKNEVLMIYRLNNWDFPKGKIEEDESPESAAVREVAEETGIEHITITKRLPGTFHVYELHGKKILKETFWFEMSCLNEKPPVPQTEEDISEVKWVAKEEVRRLLATSYLSLQDFWKNYSGTTPL